MDTPHSDGGQRAGPCTLRAGSSRRDGAPQFGSSVAREIGMSMTGSRGQVALAAPISPVCVAGVCPGRVLLS